MRKDHRPYYIKKLYLKFQKFYVNHFLRPQFDHMGKGGTFMKPWHVEIFGPCIELGDFSTIIAAPDRKIRFSVWPEKKGKGYIKIGNYCLVCPGVRIGAACGVDIGHNCMIASNAYITDSDWHDIYNRVSTGTSMPVKIKENVWIGDSAIICKGVTIGKNSIIGAGAVITKDVPSNVVAAGNPAKVVKQLDLEEKMITRSHWLSDPGSLSREFDKWDRAVLQNNTFLHWVRYMLFPMKKD